MPRRMTRLPVTDKNGDNQDPAFLTIKPGQLRRDIADRLYLVLSTDKEYTLVYVLDKNHRPRWHNSWVRSDPLVADISQ